MFVAVWQLWLLLLGVANAIFYEDGFDHHYTYSSESDILGLHNVTTIIKFRIRPVNYTSGDGSLHMLMVDSFVQHSEKGYFADNPMKWDLNKQFYFTTGPDGMVTMVHHHPEDQYEILSLKKVLTSTLSAKVTIKDEQSWKFKTEELDHTGKLEHDYEASKSIDGFTFVRTHRSSSDVLRHHQKTLHVDTKGTPLRVEAIDNITLHSDTTQVKRKSVEGEAEIVDEESNDFPKISSVSRTKVHLSAKRPVSGIPQHDTSQLNKDTLHVKEKTAMKVTLQDVDDSIKRHLDCVHMYANKFDKNRTECVNRLRQVLMSVHQNEFLSLTEEVFSRKCDTNDTICIDERNLFIDLVAKEGSHAAQKQLLNLILRQPNATEDDFRRILFHCIAIKDPSPELVQLVEGLCHGGIDVKEGTPELTVTGKRACLSLGALAKSLHEVNVTESDRIVERLENWLKPHNQTEAVQIIKPRKRRSISEYDRTSRKHIETKMVLLQSLGNAGKTRSLRHIGSYMEPNVGVSAWRRAAIHSLRHFTCNESATALLVSAVHDDDAVVRQTATKVLEKHPKIKNVTREQENIVLSKNYTYPVIARVRRGLLDTLMKGISVHIEPPGIEWDKIIGNSKIGASFGLHIRNILDLKLGLLSGHFMIDVYDGAYAEAHVGLLNFHVDIVKAFICFKGHIGYNLNVLKDFGINGIQDLVHIYDKIVAKIVNPIHNAIKAFKDIIHLFRGGGLKKVFDTIISVVKNLPHILGEVTKRLKEFVREVFSIAGSTIVEELKLVVNHVRQFVDGVKQDVLKFYHDVVDAITMALPFIGRKITEAFNLIVEGFTHLVDNPMQAITGMSRGVSQIKMAIAMAMQTKQKVLDACQFIKGRATEWFNTAKEIPKIIKRIQDIIQKLVNSVIHRRSLTDDMENTFNNGVQSMKDAMQDLKADLLAKWNNVLAPIRGIMNVTKPFIDEYKAIMDLIKGIKFAYKKVKEVIQDSKALVQKVFGPKFDKKFPTSRRDAKGGCPSGVWPTTTNDHYHTTGVDLTLGRGQSIAAPVDGIVHIHGNNRVDFQPIDPEFTDLEIVIENIEPEKNSDGKRFKSGAKIGRASKVNICKPNFIHVSVRQAKPDTVADSEYDYVDPSPYLDRLVPVPKWIQECNDHEFRYIGQTFESGESADGEPQSASEKIKRAIEGAVDDAKDIASGGMGNIGSGGDISGALDDRFGSENTVYRPDDGGLYDSTSLGDSLKSSLKEQTKQFSEFFKTALFGKDGPKIPNILEIININDKSVSWILDKLDGNSDIFKKFKGVVKNLKDGMTEIPTGNPGTIGLPLMKRLLASQGLKDLTGGISEMASQLISAPESKCPLFKGKLASVLGHFCTARCDCMGLTCSIALPIALKTNYIKIGVYVNVDEMKLELKYQDKTFTLGVNGIDEELDLSVKFMGMKASLIANFQLNADKFLLSMEAKLCNELLMTCLGSVEIVTDISFPTIRPAVNADCKTDGTTNEVEAADTEISAMNIPTFINNLGDFDKLSHDATKVLENVRDNVVKQLLDEGIDKLGQIVKEFKDKVDFCLAANIPVPPFDVEFFSLHNLFMVGPVPLSLGFGAGGSVGMGVKLGMCVLSMTVKVTLTPWVGGKVWGDAALDIGFARGGIRLVGYLLETKFPITVELVFSKYPIDLGSRMDMILTPIRLELKAFAELFLLIKRVTVYEGNIWTYTAPTIKKNIFTKHKKDDDKSPPDIQPSTLNVRKKRSGHRGCIVQQIPGRPYYDPAFKLEMYADDPVSDVKLSYAVGTNRGGTDVIGWTEMGGSSLLVPTNLPGGVPIYWTVKAKNSQGLESTTQCSLNTYDGTLPDGRVEHAYKFSSHPSKLIASVVVFDDSPLVDTHYKAIGYSAGQFGSQFVDWQPISLDHSVDRIGVSGYLRKFTVPREGKLVAFVLKTQKTSTPEDCARLCISYGTNCVSFDYETHSETCDFHDVVQGSNAYLRLSGTYKSYERLGTGYHSPIEYTNLPLKHGTIYFVNTKVTNVLGYDEYLFGEGTMVDFTPPEPGPVGRTSKDILKADNCTAAVTQQCLETTWLNNHRIIIDGPDCGTIFSGHKPRYDELYTLTNHYITANWYGFHDDESGIWGYTWAVGRQPCSTDILGFNDPYSHLSSRRFWTDSAFTKGFHLADGPYYVTVQALNGAELGGSLVTTVCHSVPFTVDTTPPVFSGVQDIIYDEDFDLIAIYYAASDDLSKIAKAEFGLGKTKYDVQLKAYSIHHAMERDDPFVSLKELGLQEGIPAWIRIRVTNNVDLFTAGHGDEPILIDRSPPLVGKVLDGDVLQKDLRYQSEDKRICAQWTDFYDPESGIERFLWGVGTHPGRDDVVKVRNLTQYEKSGCSPAILTHNTTYYSTVFAYNHALNSKATNGSSDGVLVDITPPIPGQVVDGKVSSKEDMKYTSETVTKNCHWVGYYDPESGIDKYKVDVYVNNELKDTFDAKRKTMFEDKTISLEHRDHVHFTVHGVNGAGLSAIAESDGFLVDHTPPVMTDISDEETNQPFQSNSTAMHLKWNFRDDESGIKEYRTVIFEMKEGIKQQFWPNHKSYNLMTPVSEYNGKMDVVVDKLGLKDGGKYSVHVTAINGALLSTAHESKGVIVDTTAPRAPKVHIGLMKEEEELNDHDQILHDDQNGIRVSWWGRDSESGIKDFNVAIGTSVGDESLLPFTSFGTANTAYISDIHFQSTRESNITYVVSIKAINGAGLSSPIGHSKQIYVQKANVPGVVFDGRNIYQDSKYTTDRTSIAASFYGFESESCNIIGYEWAIGMEEFGSSELSYTSYGLVMDNKTHGFMQINMELFEQAQYFVTVRARTGCRDQYILSSSDGIILDITPPTVDFETKLANDTVIVDHDGVLYQDTTDSLAIIANVSEDQEIISSSWALGSLPLSSNLKSFTSEYSVVTNAISLSAGESTFITAKLSDSAGNINLSSTPPVIGDNTPPSLTGLRCTKYISIRQGLVSCEWDSVVEYESVVKTILISIGTEPQFNDILTEYEHPIKNRYFIRDLTKYLTGNKSLTAIYLDFKVINIVDRTNDYEEMIVVDRTPPEVNGISVVTRTRDHQVATPLQCQLPTSYVELKADIIRDLESDIDESRYEIALGTNRFSTDILVYTNVNQDASGIFFVNRFTMIPGTTFYATLRSYNKAGLYADSVSSAVVVSQAPYIQVIDGPKENDIDFQSIPNIIQGRWKYSDTCPVVEAQWRITDLGGSIIEDFRKIPDAGHMFYDDEVTLQNGVKYFVTVKTVDALNRTKLATSDGVSIRIQPPFPGRVRDGVAEDINYQFSTTELSANWDSFGDTSSDPTQSISHYEVAVGNDRRYASTRTNIYYFVNVGLNTSHTFTNLNLTAKQVRYYITVRAYSLAGGFAEGYSNGIRVGYDDDIIPGFVDVKPFQVSTNSMSISWSGFQSDIGIIQYQVGVSTHELDISNDTVECQVLFENDTLFDVKPLTTVNLDQYVNLGDMVLGHGKSYYPTVIAEDESGMCMLVTGPAVTIDVTPPATGMIYVNDILSDSVVFAKSRKEMKVKWDGFTDRESGVKNTHVGLLECNACSTLASENCFSIAETVVQNGSAATFYELDLVPRHNYHINISVMNGAGLSSSVVSAAIFLDETPPYSGVIKITDDWATKKVFQSETDSIRGKLAVALSENAYKCPNQIQYLPSNNMQDWILVDNTYSRDFIVMNGSGAFLGIGYNADLTQIKKSGLIAPKINLRNGNYTFNLRASSGLNIVTSFAFVSGVKAVSYRLEDKPYIEEFDYTRLDNKTGLVDTSNTTLNVTESGSLNDTENEQNVTSTKTAGSFVPTNDTENSNKTKLSGGEFGFGVHILGYKIGNNKHFHGFFWAHNAFSSVQRWFRIDFDPTENFHSYVTSVKQITENKVTTTDIVLLLDNQEVVNIAGLRFEEATRLLFMTWNEDDYQPTINDVFHPFYTAATVRNINIPDDSTKLCLQGRPFYDGESGIKEIWAGVSDNTWESDNIAKLELQYRYCFPCKDSCSVLCNKHCTDARLSDDYNIIDLIISNLNLQETDMDSGCFNVSEETDCNSTSYYITAKVVNYAGQTTLVHSNAIQIDVTPPTCEYLRCLDPDYSQDEPTAHLGSSSAIGAYWKCTDDVSMIDYYEVHVTSSDGKDTVIQPQKVGTRTKISLKEANDTFKDRHDYMFHMTVVNSAGLRNVYNCSVSVRLFPPNISNVDTKSLFAYEPAADELPAITDSQSEIGLKWMGGNTDIEFYEWQLGTGPEADDIFPPVKVGINETGSAAIVHGELELNDEPVNKTIAEFHRQTNVSNTTTNQSQIKEKTFFLMEPGRCVHQTMYAIGWSHLKSRLKSKTVCIKRKPDIEVTYQPRKHVEIISKTKLTDEWQNRLPLSPDKTDIIIETKILSGGFTAGSLTNDDKTTSYGTAATSDFKSYISDPKLTSGMTSRILRNRISRFCNVSFFIAPTPVLDFSDIRINITLPGDCKEDPEFQPGLIYWDTDENMWRHIDEGCEPYLTHQGNDVIYTSHVCASVTNGNMTETKRSTRKTYASPKAYELAHISKTFPNHPPVILTNNLQATEDRVMHHQIETFDKENDTLIFEITESTRYATCNISHSGILNCMWEEDFYGDDYITLKITETGLPKTEKPLSVTKRIHIHIKPVPDATVRFFIDADGNVHRENRPSMVQVFHTNANSTENFFAGTIVLADVDGDEVFSYKNIIKYASLGDSKVVIKEVDISQVKMGKAIFSRFRTMKAYEIEFKYSKTLNGKMTLNFIAMNSNGEYTPSVTMDMYILKHPCVHGSCSHIRHGPDGCHDVSRSLSFDSYVCVCEAGYTAQWCQTNINECAPEPCALMFDCEDLVNGYACNINIPKLMAILLCSIVAIAGATFMARRSFLKYKEKYRKVGQSNVSLMNDIEQIRPDSAAIFHKPAVTSLPPEKTQLSISTDVMTDNDTDKPGLDLPSLAIFGPGIIKPTHHLKGSAQDEMNPVKHSKTATNDNMHETRTVKSIDQSDVTVQSRAGTASSLSRQPESASLDGGDIGEVLLQLERRPESRLTDIDV